MNRRSRPLWVRLSALLGPVSVAGCVDMVHPPDIAVAEELCAKRGGYAHVQRWERGAVLEVNCKDGTQLNVRLPKKGVTMDAMDTVVLKMQRDSLRDALAKLLDAHDREAKATMSYQNARENFSDSADERKAYERAQMAASNAEREARVLLLTLRTVA